MEDSSGRSGNQSSGGDIAELCGRLQWWINHAGEAFPHNAEMDRQVIARMFLASTPPDTATTSTNKSGPSRAQKGGNDEG